MYITNSQRLILLRYVKEDIRVSQQSSQVTIKKLEKLYDLEQVLNDKFECCLIDESVETRPA